MTCFDDFFRQATCGPDRATAGCVLAAYRVKDGVTHYKSYGTQSVDPNSPLSQKSMAFDTSMWYASCTKLITAVCALQCVEKGLLSLDEDVTTILTDRDPLQILIDFDEKSGEPILEHAKGKVTLRMLLSHQAGFGYDFAVPKLLRYWKFMKTKGQFNSLKLSDRLTMPLLYEPGTSWEYGIGLDWAGQMIEKVTNQRLGHYMEQNIFGPLGMTSTTFRIDDHPDIKSRRADMSMRENDTVIPSPTRFYADDEALDLGGGGLFSSTEDFIKILVALMKDEGTLLKPGSTKLLFEPCLSESQREKLQADRTRRYDETGMPIPGAENVSYSMGGMVTLDEIPGGRKRGGLSWGGLPNISWIMDRAAGVTLLYASQMLPPRDRISHMLMRRFEQSVYNGEFFENQVSDRVGKL